MVIDKYQCQVEHSLVTNFEVLHNNLNTFFSETNGLIQLKFKIEYPSDETILI